MDSFEKLLMYEVWKAENRLLGDDTAPWEVVAEYLVALEARVKFLEQRADDLQKQLLTVKGE